MTPRVTVLLPVHNGAAYLREAIESILSQTFADFELLILDDGSTDDSVAVVRSYPDPRIRLVIQPANMGLIATLNYGLALARGAYVARMDADDVSLPTRLARQVAYMDAHPEVGMCGTWAVIIGPATGPRRYLKFPLTHAELRCRLLVTCPFVHPSVMMRRAMFEAHGLAYDPAYPHAEDYRLWQRAAEHFPLVNLPAVLLKYRLVPDSVSHKHRARQLETHAAIGAERLNQLGLALDPAEGALFARFDDWALDLPPAACDRVEGLLLKLQAHNAAHGDYPRALFDALLGELWFVACHVAASQGRWTIGRYVASPFAASGAGLARRAFVVAARYGLHHLRRLGLRRQGPPGPPAAPDPAHANDPSPVP